MNTNCRNAVTVSIAWILAVGTLPSLADPVSYEGTATLCFIGAAPPSVERAGDDGAHRVSGLVSLYFIQTAPRAAEPPSGLVNGWELLTSDMTVTGKEYRLDWTGVLMPQAQAGATDTVLQETASVTTTDLSTLSGEWRGTGNLAGVRVDYVLTMLPDATPDCPGERPPQCADLEGGCLPAEPPYVDRFTVYEISGTVH